MKLYRSRQYPNYWFAYSPETGWVKFPAQADGWERRERAWGIDPMHIREVPVRLAAETGIPAEAGVLEAA